MSVCHQVRYIGDVCTQKEDAQCCVFFKFFVVIKNAVGLSPSTKVFFLVNGICDVGYCHGHLWWLELLGCWVVGEICGREVLIWLSTDRFTAVHLVVVIEEGCCGSSCIMFWCHEEF